MRTRCSVFNFQNKNRTTLLRPCGTFMLRNPRCRQGYYTIHSVSDLSSQGGITVTHSRSISLHSASGSYRSNRLICLFGCIVADPQIKCKTPIPEKFFAISKKRLAPFSFLCYSVLKTSQYGCKFVPVDIHKRNRVKFPASRSL